MILVKEYGLKIYNIKVDKKIPKDAVYVGRPTNYGNPYSHVPGAAAIMVKSRDAAIQQFREYCDRNKAVGIAARKHLRGKSLSCWCVPAECHASILMEMANEPE